MLLKTIDFARALVDALEGGTGSEPCPACGKPITFKVSSDGRTVDILHPQEPPQPRCAGFEAFVAQLFARSGQRPPSASVASESPASSEALAPAEAPSSSTDQQSAEGLARVPRAPRARRPRRAR